MDILFLNSSNTLLLSLFVIWQCFDTNGLSSVNLFPHSLHLNRLMSIFNITCLSLYGKSLMFCCLWSCISIFFDPQHRHALGLFLHLPVIVILSSFSSTFYNLIPLIPTSFVILFICTYFTSSYNNVVVKKLNFLFYPTLFMG